MTNLEYWQGQKAWAEKWLEVPEDQLPGKLTHEKCYAELERADDALIEFLAIQFDGAKFNLIHAEPVVI